MWHMHDGIFFGMHFLWWIFFLALMVGLFAYLTKAAPRSGDESPLEILKKRFARGEITREEYEESRRVLEQG